MCDKKEQLYVQLEIESQLLDQKWNDEIKNTQVILKSFLVHKMGIKLYELIVLLTKSI